MADTPTRIARRLVSIAQTRPIAIKQTKQIAERSEVRRSIYRPGRLIVAGNAEVECVIVDTSPNGARVQLDGAAGLPDFVILKIAVTGEARRARVVWKRDNAAGLSFKIERKPAFADSSRRN